MSLCCCCVHHKLLSAFALTPHLTLSILLLIFCRELGTNQLLSLPPGLFDQLRALETLLVYTNLLSSLPGGIFAHVALRTLNLGGNQLSQLPAGIFGQLSSLQTLDLGGNQLSQLPVGAFNQLSAITLLYERPSSARAIAFAPSFSLSIVLSITCDARFQRSRLFTPRLALSMLCLLSVCRNLGTNQLASLDNATFAGLSRLTSLYLDSNRLSVLPSSVFTLSSLRELWVQRNQLTAWPSGLANLTALTRLGVHYNRIPAIPPGALDSLTALQHLDIGGNALATGLHPALFHRLGNLTWLSLGSCGLRVIAAGAFDMLTALSWL